MRKNIRYLVIAILLILGVILSVYGLKRILTTHNCKNWTVVKGRIMDSNIIDISDLPDNNTTETSLPDIKYEYTYKGVTHFNQAISYYGNDAWGLSDTYYAGTEDQTGIFISKYPVNSAVDVYVNPKNPAESILDTGLKFPVFIHFLYGVLLIYAAFHIYLFGNLYLPDSEKLGKLI